jgi:hypothetical protein
MNTSTLFLPILLCCVAAKAFAQDEEPAYADITPKHSFTIELGLPVSTVNKPFKGIMQGLLNVSPYYQFTLQNHFSVGIGGHYSYFKINEFKTPQKVTGGMNSFGGFIKVGHEKFYNMRFGTDIGVKVGYTDHLFTTDTNTVRGGPVSVMSTFVEPSVGLVLTADEFTSFRFVVSYAFYGFGFRPDQLGLTTNGGYDPADFSKVTQFVSFGFGFTYYFKQY